MDKDFLKRAKADVIHAYMDRGIDAEGTPAEAFFRKVKDTVVALIDAALAEPDADVADAIEFWEKIKRQSIQCIEKSQNGKSYHVNLLPTMDNAGALDLAITALRQYQKPTDEAVHPDDLDSATEDAVEWLEHMKSCHIDSWNKADDEDTAEPGAYEQYKATLKALDLAIQGLRQMRMEPWIPVSERLPTEDDADEKGNVLCYWTDEAIETYQARWVDEWNSDRNHKDKITHWMPLPKPPESED